MAGEESDHAVIVKWSGQEFKLTVDKDGTVENLKKAIQDATGVLPERQKLLGLKFKGKPPGDEVALTDLKLKASTKIMMMGTREEELDKVKEAPKDLPEVVNDFDIEEDEIAIENREEYLAKIERRIKEYKISVLNEPREGKKLLVLDIDYTLFDHRSVAETANELMRPFLHEFLQSAYEHYDIVIWSATSMKWVEVKMKELGVTSNPNYKICFMLDSLAMISVHTPKYGVIEVKPLGVIWGKYEHWNPKNTIMFDDIRRNFIMNPQTGLRIRAFREAHFNRDKDRELLKLSKYLKDIAALNDFTDLNHRHWERYRPKRKHENVETKSDEKSADT
ncbi:ubiquitin-like domain-containing CTD phosphatase 1 [Crassostrea virginica]|uniref:Ubiquitin-like domain-containing CTD phosphatase 1 n=1 Tax=Crassostrea virginica TaxID=6565 RepID=A0A8B8EXA5_CRAVI|nr:ubiquitin-like domain-containing CTD phosphatase 1 [Crassostrea virginica]